MKIIKSEREAIIKKLLSKFNGKTFSKNEDVLIFIEKILDVAYSHGQIDANLNKQDEIVNAQILLLEELFPQWIPKDNQKYRFIDKNKDKIYKKLQELKKMT